MLPADSAAWIWAEGWEAGKPQVVRFTRRITLKKAASLDIHLTADQRFQFRINGVLAATGSDRSDVAHWAVASYKLELPAGRHEFEVLAWWLPDATFIMDPALKGSVAPLAQMSWRGGFLFKAEGDLDKELSTGTAKWEVQDLTAAMTFNAPYKLSFHVIGPAFGFDMAKWNNAAKPVEPRQIMGPVWEGNLWGTRPVGWRKHPAKMPEQRADAWSGGRVRSARTPIQPVEVRWQETRVPDELDKLVQGKGKVRVPANSEMEFLWDFENYHCGYPVIEVEQGKGSTMQFEWTEGLFETPEGVEPEAIHHKGHRSVIDGKTFVGFGDKWQLDGKRGVLPALWWRSGRYARIRVKTGAQPLTIKSISLRLTGYPFEFTGKFKCDDQAWMDAWRVMERGMEMSAHEHWVDCPYYEQISYVGDDVTDIGVYTISEDARIMRRVIELFDWSRRDNDFVGCRYPGGWATDAATYAMLYPRLAHDYLLWRSDADFAKEILPGLRSLVELFIGLLGKDGLMGQTAGWPFTDWVGEWLEASAPGEREGDSSLLNLHFVMALQLIARIERKYGDLVLAKRAEGIARENGIKTKARFWNAKKGLIQDDSTGKTYCEHAQAFAILSGILGPKDSRTCLNSWLSGKQHLAPASIYFSYYILEAFYQMRHVDAFHKRLEFWKGLPGQGFYTTPERPEPSRSDCHGWGSHPIYHSFASIAGIRPTAFEFEKVIVAPMPGPMRKLDLSMPHPRGKVAMKFSADDKTAAITLPKGVTGEFVFAGKKQVLKSGANKVSW